MSWYNITIAAENPTTATHYCELLETAGALAVSLQDAEDQPIYEPEPQTTPLWPHTKVSGLFSTKTNTDNVLLLLYQHGITRSQCDMNLIADEDWQQSLKQHFQPINFGDRLWICPTWSEPPKTNAAIVMLDPGLAFGTGAHATTRLCLDWLAENNIVGKNIIDYGCGSGILAIAALKLGAKEVWAVDIDEQALIATQRNARQNHIQEKLTIGLPEQLPSIKADIIIANILAKPLQQLVEHFANLLNPHGQIVLSGLTGAQLDEVCQTYEKWFTQLESVTQENWVRISGKRIN